MARIVSKHPKDFRVGDILVQDDGYEIHITEVLGWSESRRAYGFHYRYPDMKLLYGKVFFNGDLTHRVKRG